MQNDVEIRKIARQSEDIEKGFNGATCKMTWKSAKGQSLWERRGSSFNGATCKMTWKFGDTVLAAWRRLGLQWGHVQNDVEIC